ncbi:MAG: VOC family protein [Deltaproteobacteria bacterium]
MANPMSATIVANGTEILMFDGGPHFTFSPGISLFVKVPRPGGGPTSTGTVFIAGGGREDNCGWLEDKWGASWQIIPDAHGRYLGDPDREKANRVMQAMFKMKKIVVADLDRAAAA